MKIPSDWKLLMLITIICLPLLILLLLTKLIKSKFPKAWFFISRIVLIAVFCLFFGWIYSKYFHLNQRASVELQDNTVVTVYQVGKGSLSGEAHYKVKVNRKTWFEYQAIADFGITQGPFREMKKVENNKVEIFNAADSYNFYFNICVDEEDVILTCWSDRSVDFDSIVTKKDKDLKVNIIS